MEEGEEKHIEIEPENAFGKRDLNSSSSYHEEFKKQGIKPYPGMVLYNRGP